MCDQTLSGTTINLVEVAVSFSTNNFENQNSKTKYIRFPGELPMHQILWRNVAADTKTNKYIEFTVDKKGHGMSEIDRR